MDAPLKFQLPIWNGVQDVSGARIAPLWVGYSRMAGLYKQLGKRIISYEEQYQHMTQLGGSTYSENLRKGKIDWVLSQTSGARRILEIGGGDSFNSEFFD